MKWHISVLSLISCSVILVCAESNQCPDSKAVCPEATTCCQLNNNTFGCCPVENAVCCKDSIHCCPVGYSCDIEKGVCKLEGKSVPLLEKVPSTSVSNEVVLSSVSVCPGGEHQCPVDHSCCPILGSSHFHCCPSGYSCDQGVCQEAKPEFPAVVLNKFSAKVVKCDKKFACPDRYTCCKADQGYLCCPLEEAVCCADHKHCCPRGYTCSPDGKGCSSGAHSILALSTTLPTTSIKGVKRLLQLITRTFSEELQSRTFRHQVNNVVCPDDQSECPDDTTCCKLSSGQWGCCPLPQAVCCSDGEHCCPNGYTCNVAEGTCTKGDKTAIPMSKKIPALKIIIKANNVVCPDGESECPNGSTCCKLFSGQWGCCPLPKAVCCSDGVHCCPNGYTCDVEQGTCTKGETTFVPVSIKVQALKRIIKSNSVVCPDGEAQCPDDNTCCKLSSGQWGCCPLPRAVCCSDGEHCCPNGYTCDVAEGTCTKGDKTAIPMSKKIPALKRIIKANVVCPDGKSECPNGSTCCKLFSGQWGCCPLPKAVCCSDGVHCCPNGYTCDVEQGTCTKGDTTFIPVSIKVQALKRIIKSNSVVCPDGEAQCPDDNTCCKLPSGQWGCCPLPRAVCCSDGEHCCPNGYTCDVAEGTCTKGDKTAIPMSKKIPALKRIIKANVVCPDGKSECPNGSTCCKLFSGQWGCCPLPKAVCCSDGVHCCPNGYTCDVEQGTCTKGDTTFIPVSIKVQALKRIIKSNSVVCPDGEAQCPDDNTCCKLPSGQWGCCPLPRAVCCSDGEHCCPNGYTCDVAEGTCTKGDKTAIPMTKKIPALKRIIKANRVVCPDGRSECRDDMTCCKLSSGQWGCCPLPKAVCCSDGEHCCPNGYTCDVAEGTCSKGDKTVIQMSKKIQALKRIMRANNAVCPDGQSECPDGSTCCKLSSGQWGCCPLPEAVCCSDGVHCCPNGYTCDVAEGTCTQGDKTVIQMSKKIPAFKRITKANNVVCPDGQSECPDSNTCCKLSSGQWGCCPLPKAVCCSDGVHCCPNGYTCDVAEGTCTQGDKTVIQMSKKIPAFKRITKANNVVCPDGQSECPDGNTCCKLSSGQWGCCPLPKAVCCSDGEHCCPNGYTCDVAEGTCTQGDKTVIQMSKKIQAFKRITKANNVVCPDGQSECPDGNTCCKLSSGQWGCCPLPKAVCCSDGEHCCPNGYTCDVAEGTCTQGDKTVIQMSKKIQAFKRITKASNVVCPDGQSECPDGNTCCKLSSGQWGCCPLPKAVCCSDGEHCCPNGYTCDVAKGTCTQGDKTVIQMSKKIPAFKRITKANNVVCPDGQSECPDGNTCCKLSSGQWGCCPLPKAVCCSDGEHCCPNGYTCDVAEGTCTQGDKTVIQMSKKIPAFKRITKANNVVCPDGQSECPDGNTCCKLSSGQWGCCPLPKAVCCSDGEHCCPNGYTCDVAEGTCTQGDKTVIQMSKKIPAFKRITKANNVVCPDGQSECPDGNTCCKLSSGQWGCCPLPKAVCCSDGEHCCPNGYTCDVAEGTCTQGDKTVIQMSKKIPAFKRITKANNVVCPDGQSECPDGNTCCKLSSGQWGCCPLPKAVCCSDGEHCCPNGYTCDVEAGTCNKGSKTRIGMFTKIPAIKKITIVDTVMCPDDESQCPDDNTCCKLSSGQWGCCPLPKAVCCSDGEHCCPNGYTCDVALGTCTKGDKDVTDHLVVQPSKRVSYDVKTVFCNDGETECPNGYTCCRDISGGYSCCHLDQAVCCSDKVHCCPMGSTCTSNGTCQESSSGLVQKMITLVKSPARPVSDSSGSVLCPDKKHECANGSTCCKLHSGLYGCCPVSHAVCCSDDKHCCPGGYTCDVEKGTCDRYGDQVSFSEIIPFTRASTETYVDCPDRSQCLDYETCCMMDTGHYGCCPLPKAVCCSDEEHCCPEGYRCDLSSETCVAGDVRIPMLIKTTAARRHQNTQKLTNLDEKIRFIPGPPVRGNP